MLNFEHKRLFLVLLFTLLTSLIFGSPALHAEQLILKGKVEGVINPIMAEYMEDVIKKGESDGASLVIFEMDTPGGLDSSMRRIIKAMVNASIPVVIYVAPPGARAASAGCIIGMASHVLAMAPATNIGAAHPVSLGRDLKEDDPMTKKVLNDMVAYAQGLTKEHGRNVDWIKKAIVESASAEASEALSMGICDITATSLDDLLEKIEGRKVDVLGKARIINTAKASIVTHEMNFRQRLLMVVSNPNVAYMLLMFGLYGIIFELASPGAIFPGVIGAICLILGFFGLEMLPVSYAGLALIGIGILLLILEVKVTSFGLLSIGGVGSMTLGSIMLFKTQAEYLRVSLNVLLPIVGTTALLILLVVWLVTKAHIKKPASGMQGIIGMRGRVFQPIGPDGFGRVMVHGEIWTTSNNIKDLPKGHPVKVTGINGLILDVKPLNDS